MAGMRVHELAKEFDMTSKDLLARLADMKIPAKSHASILQEAYVEKIRKNLEPEIKQRAGQLEEEEAKKLAEEQAKIEAQKEEEAAARRAAVEKERQAREAERARRESQQKEGFAGSKKDDAEAESQKKVPSSPFESLSEQIERERERVEREAHEAKVKAEAEARAADVAKKQAVEEALASRKGSKTSKPAKKAAPVAAPSTFSSLLDQINNERERLSNQVPDANDQSRGGRGKKSDKRKGFEPVVPELENSTAEGEDRYAQMAVQAEKFQRDKVLAEARAAVEAASHEGQGRRKKRKEKREAEARERAELEALEKGLDPTLVLDDSVVEVAQGSTVAQFAELLDVSPNDIIKRLFLLGSALTLTQTMSDDLIELIADDLGRKVRVVSPEEEFAFTMIPMPISSRVLQWSPSWVMSTMVRPRCSTRSAPPALPTRKRVVSLSTSVHRSSTSTVAKSPSSTPLATKPSPLCVLAARRSPTWLCWWSQLMTVSCRRLSRLSTMRMRRTCLSSSRSTRSISQEQRPSAFVPN